MRTFQVLQQLFATDHQTFVTGLFREFLNRNPTLEDLANFADSSESVRSKNEILESVIMSIEFQQLFSCSPSLISILQQIMCKEDYEFVTLLHNYMFGQHSKLMHIQQNVELLRTGVSKLEILEKHLLNDNMINYLCEGKIDPFKNSQINIQQILHDILKQDGHAFITQLYMELLSRNPRNDELKTFTKSMSLELSKTDIFKMLIQDPEFTALVQKKPLQSLMQFFQQLIKTDEETFVAKVYLECHGRTPDFDGFQHYVHLLKSGTSKLDILRTVLLSEEAVTRFHALNREDRKNTLISTDYSTLWPHMPIDKVFRENVKEILSAHKFPYSTNILVKTGGLGDFVQMTAVAKALKTKEPERPIVAIIGYCGSLFDEHPYIDLAIECGSMDLHQVTKSVVNLVENVFDLRYVSRAYGTWKNTDYYYKNLWFYNHFPNSGIRVSDLNKHVCDLMLYSLGLEKYANCNDVFIKPNLMIEKILGDYVVVSDSAGSVPGELKRWSEKGWDGLIKWLHSQGIIPVQLGVETDSLLHSGVMDLRGKTTPRQAAGYLKLSKGYIGIEGGIYHLAKAVGAPSVVIFASTSETCFAYPDTHVVTRRLCQPCWWNESWTQAKCLHGKKTCLNLPDLQSVTDAVSKILKTDESIF
ncbi:DUF4214 domain-containing protein [Marinisporobacter balticus]|uniref:ADP-heptose:LPS heptosyltransferase n=1 Tax=Marinisporobacter balticus TaxID=2018667 RepID=A0A4R2L0J4_9FIRM|nr:DUF4214 domain-containing protein [Marinisporobacter balticus]TCO79052.1 ADP-heptose:LPS heptosyltransferase [Marinisporobacter balticus]